MVHGHSCPEACGIFLAQGLNPCLLNWQADSLPLSHQEVLGFLCCNMDQHFIHFYTQILSHCPYLSHFVYSVITDGHLDCSHHLVFVNYECAAMNVHRFLFEYLFSSFWSVNLRMELLDHMVVLGLPRWC